jgi:hypothetical protein
LRRKVEGRGGSNNRDRCHFAINDAILTVNAAAHQTQAIQVAAEVLLTVHDLYPPVPAAGHNTLLVWKRWRGDSGVGEGCVNGSLATTQQCVDGIVEAEDLAIPLHTGQSLQGETPLARKFVYHLIAPYFPKGFTLLGEARKWVPASPHRFVDVTLTAASVTGVSLRGAKGEVVELILLRPQHCNETEPSPLVHRLAVTLDADGAADVLFDAPC